MIEVKNVTKVYNDGAAYKALENINIKIENGEFVAIVGRSGSGKSTLLNALGLIDGMTEGEIYFDNTNISKLTSNEQSIFRNQNIGFVFQAFHLEPMYSVYKNIEIPLLIAGVKKEERKMRVEQVLKKVGLFSMINKITNNLSGGEKQRVAIARALINNPKVILADEPCGNLDVQNSQAIMNIFKELKQNEITVVLITHNMQDALCADRIIQLEDGKVKQDESC